VSDGSARGLAPHGDTQSILVILLGAAVTRIAVDNTFLQYVRAGLRPWLIAAGVVLILVGIACLVRDFRQKSPGHRLRVGWLLVLPVLAIFVVAPGALGAYSASRGGGGVGTAPPDSNGFSPLPAGNPVPDTVRDFSERALWDNARTLHGRHVQLTGFVTPADAHTIYLTRMFITCCAADASPVRIAITGPIGNHPANSWLKIAGTYAGVDTKNLNGGDPVPIVRAESITSIKPPTNPYEN
jgi:uncharacterized repeat protein (TIGR03943 family)